MLEPPYVRRLGSPDAERLQALNALFGAAFEDPENYAGAPPSLNYLEGLLVKPHVVALTAEVGGELAGGLVAYVLDKFEQERREIYIYDIAVAEAHRRQGVATALIHRLQQIAPDYGAKVIFVQADRGDDPAIALYESLGEREEVLHFDIPAAKEDQPLWPDRHS